MLRSPSVQSAHKGLTDETTPGYYRARGFGGQGPNPSADAPSGG